MAFNSRSTERCRDYEALQVAGDLKAAIRGLKKVEILKGVESYSFRQRLYHSHPLGRKRFGNLMQAYKDGLKSGSIIKKNSVDISSGADSALGDESSPKIFKPVLGRRDIL